MSQNSVRFIKANTHKQVYLILDEFILAGELQETSKKAIIERMTELERQE
jgi:AP-2 complex subunit sigma-1